MPSIHFRFKNEVDYDTVTFDGINISVGDLKAAILRRIGKESGAGFGLEIKNAQTKIVFADGDVIPKNSSVEVARVPLEGAKRSGPKRMPWLDDQHQAPAKAVESPKQQVDSLTAASHQLSNEAVSEEERISKMFTLSTQDFDPSKYQKTMPAKIPQNYVCYNCNEKGHFIQNCPKPGNNENRRGVAGGNVRMATGIPRSQMVNAQLGDPGALAVGAGGYAVPAVDRHAYAVGKKEIPPFGEDAAAAAAAAAAAPAAEPAEVPAELLCPLCRDLMVEASLITCCGNSFCDDCIREKLLTTEEHDCPSCGEPGQSPAEALVRNNYLRKSVQNFKNETGYHAKRKTRKEAAPPAEETPPDRKQERSQGFEDRNYGGYPPAGK